MTAIDGRLVISTQSWTAEGLSEERNQTCKSRFAIMIMTIDEVFGSLDSSASWVGPAYFLSPNMQMEKAGEAGGRKQPERYIRPRKCRHLGLRGRGQVMVVIFVARNGIFQCGLE